MAHQAPNPAYQQGYAQQGYAQPQQQYATGQAQQQYGGQGQPTHGSTAWHASDSGSFNGGSYQIAHRDTNSILCITLNNGGSVKSRPGAMIEMAGTVNIQGKTKFSMKKMFTGGQMHESIYTGQGLLSLAPIMLGDVATLQIDGSTAWKAGKDAFLGATMDVHKEVKSQGIGKALFSGEDLFVYHISGQGLLWVSSFGAIVKREIAAGETHVVDNGHLVAWNCDYKIEKAGGGLMSSLKTGEGAVCRFIGPGTVYLQTRNLEDFAVRVCEAGGAQTS